MRKGASSDRGSVPCLNNSRVNAMFQRLCQTQTIARVELESRDARRAQKMRASIALTQNANPKKTNDDVQRTNASIAACIATRSRVFASACAEEESGGHRLGAPHRRDPTRGEGARRPPQPFLKRPHR